MGRGGVWLSVVVDTVVCCTMPTPLLLILALLVTAGSWRGVGSSEWGYADLDHPEGWTGVCATGKHQSPINLAQDECQSFSVEPLVLIHYDKRVKTTFKNNGHTVVLTVDQPCEVAMSSGDLRGLYQLDELHFHWGSEHTIDGKRYALELHLVHHNSKYGTKVNALNYTRGLAVIGVMFHESEEDNPALEPVIEALEQVVKSDTTTSLPELFSPEELLPQDRSHFFRYYGSLTTPPCLESVVWTVLKTSIPVSKEQLEKFHNIHSPHGPMGHNFRKTQPLNGRHVYLLSDEEREKGISSITTSHPVCLLTALLLSLYFKN